MKSRIRLPHGILAAVAGLIVSIGPIAAQNKSVYIPRTEHTDGDGTQSLSQAGGLLKIPMSGPDRALSFWVKRNLPADEKSLDPNRSNGDFLGAYTSSGTEFGNPVVRRLNISASFLPKDSQWRYVMVTFEDNNDRHRWKLYIDGNTSPEQTGVYNYEDQDYSIFIGAGALTPSFGIKGPSNLNVWIDDISVWNSVSDDLLDHYVDVAELGMGFFDANRADLDLHYTCDTPNNSPEFFQDITASSSSVAISNNAYVYRNAASPFAIAPTLDADDSKRGPKIRVVVESDFNSGIRPDPGEYRYVFDPNLGPLEFTAPEMIYLDKYGNELGTSDDDVAAFIDRAVSRAVNVGYAVREGAGEDILGTERLFTQPRTKNTTIVWSWKMQHAIIVDTATDNVDGLDALPGSPTLNIQGQGIANVERYWVDAGTIVNAEIDSLIDTDDASGSIRFRTTGFAVENAPNGTERYATFTDGFDHLRADNTGLDLSASRDFTIEFWARRNEADLGTPGAVISMDRTWTGFTANGRMRFGSKTGPNYLVSHTDTEWHHWAFLYDTEDQEARVYRDGAEIWARSTDGSEWNFGYVDLITIGGRRGGDTWKGANARFAGDVDSLRVWSVARTQSDIESGMGSAAIGDHPDLRLEMTFDQTDDDGTTFGRSAKLLGPNDGIDLSGIPLPSSGYTLEAMVRFPLPKDTSLGAALFYGDNSPTGHHALINWDDLLVVTSDDVNREWESQSRLSSLSSGWHRISVSAKASGTTFYVSELPFPSPAPAFLETELTNIGNSGDGESRPIGFIDDVRVWDRALSQSDVEDLEFQELDGDEANLLAYYSFNDGTATDLTGNGNDGVFLNGANADLWLTSNDNTHIPFRMMNYPSIFSASSTEEEILATAFPTLTRKLRDPNLSSGPRYSAGSYTIDSWLRISWTFEKQYLLKILAGPQSAPFTDMPFLKIDGILHQGSNPNGIWVRDLAEVTVGTQYRTDDRCFTLSGFSGQLGAFSEVTMNTIVDGANEGGAATREFTIDGLTSAGSVTFLYDETIYRAEIPLGEFLNVSSLSALNAQLTPDLCDGAALSKVEAPRLIGASQRAQAFPSEHTIMWDRVMDRLFPLKAGELTLAWEDADDSSKSYQIQIVSGFPTETEPFSWDREDDNGFRDGAHGAYVNEIAFGSVEDTYPASPGAHYHHLATTDPSLQPPTRLDLNDADRWNFVALTFSDAGATYDFTDNFTAANSGKSALLFSYRPNALEVANGDLSHEALAVRVIESRLLEDSTSALTDVSSGIGAVAEFNGASDHYLYLNSSDTSRFEIYSDQERTVEFWLNRAEPDPDRPNADQVIYEQSGSGVFPDGALRFGLRSASNANPGAFFVEQSGVEGAIHFAVETQNISVNSGWTHWAITFSPNRDIRIYMDGRLVIAANERLPFDAPEYSEFTLGKSMRVPSNRLGQMDNFRIWSRIQTIEEIRENLRLRDPSDTSGLEVAALFDTYPIGDMLPLNGLNIGVSLHAESTAIASAMLTHAADAPAEVATRITSKLDGAAFESGYITISNSNYNPTLYSRDQEVGDWGPIYPTNWSGAIPSERGLKVIYYQNPFRSHPTDNSSLHPNVAWPHWSIAYESVDYPTFGPHKDRRIYISSRLGTEGVDAVGNDQPVFDPTSISELAIYTQPDRTLAGYNPNEEHALITNSIKDVLTGNPLFNLGQSAAFALQYELNRVDRSSNTYTSDPWTLVQWVHLATGEPKMAAFRVEAERDGAGSLYPALDPITNEPVDFFGNPIPQPADPDYRFEYPAYAGDPLVPPHPLNQILGNVAPSASWGGNISTSATSQRTLWIDRNRNFWTVSGDGRYFFRYWYPFREDFWYDLDGDGENDLETGTPIAWLPKDDALFLEDADVATLENDEPAQPVNVIYNSYWRGDYATLKRGESLTYAGGENKAENPSSEGLPALVAFASAELLYDSVNPPMLVNEDTLDLYSARIVRPLDRFEEALERGDLPTNLNPANTDEVMVDGSRWYFRDLPGSLQKRFYYDSVEAKLVFRGRLNDLELGDPDLTQTPVALSVLESNTMTQAEFETLRALGLGFNEWISAVRRLYRATQDPHGTGLDVNVSSMAFYSGIEPNDTSRTSGPAAYYLLDNSGAATLADSDDISAAYASLGLTLNASDIDAYRPIDSLGVGAALVPNSEILLESSSEPRYLTIAENNHEDAQGAVSLHIVKIGADRFRGAIKMIEAQDVFDEKVNLQHSGDFGGNTQDIYYQWWVRDITALDDARLPTDDVGWQLYTQGLGLNRIAFQGRPDVSLADKLFYVRFGHALEMTDVTGQANSVGSPSEPDAVTNDSWRLVDINDASDTYERLGADLLSDALGDPIPFQWAGAFNSPQLLADGSRRFLPQLVMGWVKRTLDRINPYEARFTDFYNNESPATYSSMIQIAGEPFNGKVALNSDKDVIENVGLIPLYETILQRASELTLDTALADEGTNAALLLAATRLASLYELLGRDAYTDAQDPTIAVSDLEDFTSNLRSVAPYTHAFYEQQATVQDEELALLRGVDFVKAFPSFNRLFWNYVKGIGEAAYNANYNIQDNNADGFINEFDAAIQYPQGHGDAWGHFLSANAMHYKLLRHLAFDWERAPELYGLMDNVFEVDYLDEKSFARIAAAKARAGEQIVEATYRRAYTHDPDGQWQGYTDPDSSRAWGVSEWAKRAGQAAYFDWAIGNALIPETSEEDAEDLEIIDRRANQAELSEIAHSIRAIAGTLDGANSGFNPLGLDQDTLAFDIDPSSGQSHFEQIYQRAVDAAINANAILDLASREDNKLRRISHDSHALQVDALRQDLDYRNRLIEIFGTPYSGKIGPGEPYPEGYEGPDTLLYFYLDKDDVSDIVPEISDVADSIIFTDVDASRRGHTGLSFDHFLFMSKSQRYVSSGNQNQSVKRIFDNYLLGTKAAPDPLDIEIDLTRTSTYGFQARANWGARRSYGQIQEALATLLAREVDVDSAIAEYAAYLREIVTRTQRIEDQLNSLEKREASTKPVVYTVNALKEATLIALIAINSIDTVKSSTERQARILLEGLPRVAGLAFDPSFAARATLVAGTHGIGTIVDAVQNNLSTVFELISRHLDAATGALETRKEKIDQYLVVADLVEELAIQVHKEEAKRMALGQKIAEFEIVLQTVQNAQARGFRLLDEREAFNMRLAASTQRNRYNDMVFRLGRDETLTQYQNALELSLRYTWLAAKAYDYETSLDPTDPAAATGLFETITKTRHLGLWENQEPRMGKGGLAGILARMKANYDTLKGQIGILNPQRETGLLSLRHSHFRIGRQLPSSAVNWAQTLRRARVDDLNTLPEFKQYCRPFANPESGPQPGMVLEFATDITPGKNVFGLALGENDHAFSAANFATKIHSVGVWFEGYNDAALSTAPRVYLLPAGNDILRQSNAGAEDLRMWNVVEQRIPAPFPINNDDLERLDFIPSVDTLNGVFAAPRRFGDIRAHHISADTTEPDSLQLTRSSRLVGRSVWNTRWLLIIPGATLHADPEFGVEEFADHVSDIKLQFETYSHEGN